MPLDVLDGIPNLVELQIEWKDSCSMCEREDALLDDKMKYLYRWFSHQMVSNYSNAGNSPCCEPLDSKLESQGDGKARSLGPLNTGVHVLLVIQCCLPERHSPTT